MAKMSFPYDGVLYSYDKNSSALFSRILLTYILLESVLDMRLIIGNNSFGWPLVGAKEDNMVISGEMENILPCNMEDSEKMKDGGSKFACLLIKLSFVSSLTSNR